MDITALKDRGLVLLGCGKMGSAMLKGWLAEGLPASSVWVQDPAPSDWVKGQGVWINTALPAAPAVVVVAVKPQIMADALPDVAALSGRQTVFLSVAAGTPISEFTRVLGPDTPIVRAMPNTPSAVGQGITALIGNDVASTADQELATQLMQAVGETVHLKSESEMDAVTGVSGSGPAYVFHMIEALAAAGEAQGLSSDLAMKLAKATVAGAGALAQKADETPAQLRINVTSPNGTTQAGLDQLMDAERGLAPLMRRTVNAAAQRSRELGRD